MSGGSRPISSSARSSTSLRCTDGRVDAPPDRHAVSADHGCRLAMLTLPESPVTINRSKVERPSAPGQWASRPRIDARLDQGRTRLLTAVVAPAGHGKTTTVVAWLRSRGLDAAWVSVDSRDAMLTRFAAHVATALDRV